MSTIPNDAEGTTPGPANPSAAATSSQAFIPDWSARFLPGPPLIAPARQFVYPLRVPGEEDAMARGALLLEVRPANADSAGGSFLATCALGFRDPVLPAGVFACPRPADMLAVAGGYAYLIDTLAPERCLHLPLRPVTQLLAVPAIGLLLLAGFHTVAAIDAQGLRWQTARLSWEGVTLQGVHGGRLHGTGWNMQTDREVPFSVELAAGSHEGGGF